MGGLAREGSADMHLVTLIMLMERSVDWNDDVRVLKVDLRDAFGANDYEVIGES